MNISDNDYLFKHNKLFPNDLILNQTRRKPKNGDFGAIIFFLKYLNFGILERDLSINLKNISEQSFVFPGLHYSFKKLDTL